MRKTCHWSDIDITGEQRCQGRLVLATSTYVGGLKSQHVAKLLLKTPQTVVIWVINVIADWYWPQAGIQGSQEPGCGKAFPKGCTDCRRLGHSCHCRLASATSRRIGGLMEEPRCIKASPKCSADVFNQVFSHCRLVLVTSRHLGSLVEESRCCQGSPKCLADPSAKMLPSLQAGDLQAYRGSRRIAKVLASFSWMFCRLS